MQHAKLLEDAKRIKDTYGMDIPDLQKFAIL